MKISVIIPAYNEAKTILNVLEKVNNQRSIGYELEIIVIDDGSADKTRELIEENPSLVDLFISLDNNGGKGAAVKAGLLKATGDYILFQDADLEYNTDDYEKIFYPAKEFNADVVFGSRLNAPYLTRVHYYWNKIGNRLITFFFNILNNTTFTDIYSCYLMYRRDLVSPNELKTMGWEQQAEILSKAVNRGNVFYEVPIAYFGRTYDEGKKIRPYHIIGVFKTILWERLIR